MVALSQNYMLQDDDDDDDNSQWIPTIGLYSKKLYTKRVGLRTHIT